MPHFALELGSSNACREHLSGRVDQAHGFFCQRGVMSPALLASVLDALLPPSHARENLPVLKASAALKSSSKRLPGPLQPTNFCRDAPQPLLGLGCMDVDVVRSHKRFA